MDRVAPDPFEWTQDFVAPPDRSCDDPGTRLIDLPSGVLLVWEFDVDGYHLLVRLTDAEAAAVRAERPTTGMLEPVRATLTHRGAFLVVVDRGPTMVRRYVVNGAYTEKEFVEDLYRAAERIEEFVARVDRAQFDMEPLPVIGATVAHIARNPHVQHAGGLVHDNASDPYAWTQGIAQLHAFPDGSGAGWVIAAPEGMQLLEVGFAIEDRHSLFVGLTTSEFHLAACGDLEGVRPSMTHRGAFVAAQTESGMLVRRYIIPSGYTEQEFIADVDGAAASIEGFLDETDPEQLESPGSPQAMMAVVGYIGRHSPRG